MQFDDDKVDLSELDDRRGQSAGSGGGRFGGASTGPSSADALGGLGALLGSKSLGGMGGIGLLIVVALLLFQACQGSSQPATTTPSGAGAAAVAGDPSGMASRCTTAQAIAQYDDCYILKSFNEVNEVWAKALPAQIGEKYRKPKLVFFTKAVRTGCGTAQSNAGPFYCPPDQGVYFDLAYMNTLFEQIGAKGRYAQTYVVAHEVGHHLQTLLGTEEQVRRLSQKNPSQANKLSVKLELQADCYAGVYGRLANDAGNQKITQAEFEQALVAAAAVGDDAIMASSGMRVNPDNFTHGTSEQRKKWFDTGFRSGSVKSCNTFA